MNALGNRVLLLVRVGAVLNDHGAQHREGVTQDKARLGRTMISPSLTLLVFHNPTLRTSSVLQTFGPKIPCWTAAFVHLWTSIYRVL